MEGRKESAKGVVVVILGVVLAFQLCPVAKAQVTYNDGDVVLDPTGDLEGVPVYNITSVDVYVSSLEIGCQAAIVNFDAQFDAGFIYVSASDCPDTDCPGPTLNFGRNASAGNILAGPCSNVNLYGGFIEGDGSVQVDPGAQVTIYGDVFDVELQGEFNTYGPGTVIDGTNDTALISAYELWYDGDREMLRSLFTGVLSIAAGASVLLDAEAQQSHLEVLIDVIPWSNPSVINMRCNYKIPVAVLSDETFDATQLQPETVEFAGAKVVLCRKDKYAARRRDVNRDGHADMVFYFNKKDLVLEKGVKKATLALTGQLMVQNNLVTIEGTDTVYVLWPRKVPSFRRKWHQMAAKYKAYKAAKSKRSKWKTK